MINLNLPRITKLLTTCLITANILFFFDIIDPSIFEITENTIYKPYITLPNILILNDLQSNGILDLFLL